MHWPPAPLAPKLTYVQALAGLVRQRDTATVLRTIAFGSDDVDRDAFVLPVAVATGHDGRIAVADMGRRRVHLYIPAQRRYLQLAGSEQEPIASPVSVIFDDELRLYLSDSAGRLLAFAPDGTRLFTVRHLGPTPLQRPTGLAYSPSKRLLYVVDTLAHRISAIHPDGTLAFVFGERGDGIGQFNFPTHIFRSPAGELYVSDALNFRIAIFDEDGTARGAFGRHGDGSGDLAMPKGVAVDRDGIVYVVDGRFDHVQLFNRQGEYLLTVGQRGTGFGEFWLPAGAFVGGDELYVCDTYNRRVQVFRLSGANGGGA